MPATRSMLVLSLLVPTRSSSYMKDNDLLEAELARLERQIGTAAAVATSRHDSNATQKPMRCASMRLLHQPRRSVPRNVTSCTTTPHECMCSVGGCASQWRCRPSRLCFERPPVTMTGELPPRVALLLFLNFNRSLVRNKYAKRPHAAYAREHSRISWFLRSAKRVGTRLPIHVVVGPERDEKKEATLVALGAHITPGVPVAPPAWSHKFHRLTFAKIGALALTQFDKARIHPHLIAHPQSLTLSHLHILYCVYRCSSLTTTWR